MCNFSFPKNVRVAGKTSARANGVEMYVAEMENYPMDAYYSEFGIIPQSCFTDSDHWEQWKEYMKYLDKHPGLETTYAEYLDGLIWLDEDPFAGDDDYDCEADDTPLGSEPVSEAFGY